MERELPKGSWPRCEWCRHQLIKVAGTDSVYACYAVQGDGYCPRYGVKEEISFGGKRLGVVVEAMADNEEQLAASALADMLASVMLRAYEEHMGPRTQLYCWERDGLQWLIRFTERREKWTMNAWTASFLELNREAILAKDGPMDFNLKAFDERRQAEKETA